MNVITHPPYGGDKVSQSDEQIQDYIKKELSTLKQIKIIENYEKLYL